MASYFLHWVNYALYAPQAHQSSVGSLLKQNIGRFDGEGGKIGPLLLLAAKADILFLLCHKHCRLEMNPFPTHSNVYFFLFISVAKIGLFFFKESRSTKPIKRYFEIQPPD